MRLPAPLPASDDPGRESPLPPAVLLRLSIVRGALDHAVAATAEGREDWRAIGLGVADVAADLADHLRDAHRDALEAFARSIAEDARRAAVAPRDTAVEVLRAAAERSADAAQDLSSVAADRPD